MYKETDKCRICGNKNLEVIFDLGEQYLTGTFPRVGEDFEAKGPVTLVKCTGEGVCGLVQLLQSYDLELMYGDNYGYRSGLNASMVRHLEAKIAKIEREIILNEGDIVVDIGANDGTSLRAYCNKKIRRIGVDPTIKKFSKYYPPEIVQIADFFPCAALDTHLEGKKCNVITSFSMFYDLEDPVAFAKSIAHYLDEKGLWVFEQSYLPSMLATNSFDTICHEHIEFYSLKQLKWILDEAGLKIVEAELNAVNGGSISITATHKSNNNIGALKSKSLSKLLSSEKEALIENEETWNEFRDRVNREKSRLLEIIKKTKINGGKVYGLGASTKGNVLLQFYGLNKSNMEAIFEVNKDKFNCITPGGEIRIIPENKMSDLVEDKDIVIVLPWHFKDFFLKNPKLTYYNLVFPLPIVKWSFND
ncbi:class I SAM-dependent methyltransferase [Paracoccaceae bacterium]|nr:class I SAM-dependent methyltransferase [Paracoccaceae bacterium]